MLKWRELGSVLLLCHGFDKDTSTMPVKAWITTLHTL